MADKSEISLNGKPISTLRVVDLKQELEKRGLSKSGSKKDLVDRLKLQLQIERLHNSSEQSEVEPSDRSADLVPNISLQDDVIAEQNDFIKKYLADQQKSYAIQKEARRLVELENYRSSDAEASSSQEEEGSPEKDDNKRKGKLNEEHIKVEEITVDQLGDVSSPEKKSRRRTRTSSNQENKDSEEKDELSFKQPSEPQITKTPEKTRRRTRSSLQSEDKDIEVSDICDQTKDGEFIETQGNTSVKTEEINHETEPENKTLHPQENYEGMMINLDTAEKQTDQSAVKVEVQSTGKNQENDVEKTDNKNTHLNDKQPDGKDINKTEELKKSSLDLQTEIQVEVNTKDSIKNKTLTEITDKGKEKVKEDTNNCNKIENEPADPPRTRRIQRNYWKFRRDSEKLKEGALSESKMSLEMMTEQSKEESLTKEDEQMQEREQSKEQSSTKEEKIQRTTKNTKEYENKLVLGMSQKVEPIPPLEEEMKTDVNGHQDEAKKLCIKELNIEERNTKTENKEQKVDKFKKHQDLDQKMDTTHEDVLERSKLEEQSECIEAETDEKDNFRNKKKEVDREEKTGVENYLCEVGRENEQDFNKKKKEITDKEQKKENDEIQNKHETAEMVRIENEQESMEEKKNEIKIKLNEQESKIGQEQTRQSEFKAGLNIAKQLKTTTEQEQQSENSGTERKQAGQVDDKADIKLADDLRTKQEQVGQAEFNASLKLIKTLKIKAEQDQTENLGTKQEQAGQLEVKENLKLTKALETTIDKEQAENLGTKQEQGEEVEFKGNLKLAKTLETITEQEQAEEVEVKGDLKLTKVLESTVGQEQAEEMDMKNVQLQSMDLEGREDQEYIENIETKISVVQAVGSTVSQKQAEEMDLKNIQIQTKDVEDIEEQKYTENIETKISVVQAVESTVGQKQAEEMDIKNIQEQTKDLESREEHVENVETKISVVQAAESTVEQEQAEEMDIKNIQVQTKDLEGREEHVENIETKISVEQAVENTGKVDQEPTKCIVLDYQNTQMVERRIHDDNERFSESKRNWETDDDVQRVNVSKSDEIKELEEKACVSEKKNSQEIDVQNGNLFTTVCDTKEESDVKTKENQEVFSQHELDQKHEEDMAHENSVKSGKKTGLTKKQVVDTKEDKSTTKTVKEFSKSISKTKSFKKDSYSSVGQKSEETDVRRKDGECSPSSLIVDPDVPESSKSQTCRKSRNRSRERNGNRQHKSSSSVSSSSSRSSRSSSCSRSSSQNSGQSSRKHSRSTSRSSSRSRSSSPESQQEKNRNKKSRSQSSTSEPNVNDVDSKDRVITASCEKKEEPESVVNEKFSPARDVDILEVTVDEHKKEIIEEGIQAKEEKKRPPINLTPRRLSVRGNKDRETVKSDEISQPRRKRKWATSMNSIPKVSLSISTDALKNLLPEDVPETPPTPENPSPDPVPNSESANSPEDGPPPPKREIKLKRPEIRIEPRAPSKEPEEVNDAPLEEVEIVDIKENKEHTPSPAKNPKSNIIFIRNLVRPFTLLQLKDLLAKTGTLVDGGFWIDKIKSKCCVTYETEEQAEETRKALHGVQWPISNPKTLIVDFATKEELDQYLYEEIPPIKKTVLSEDKSKEHKQRDEWLGDRKKVKDVEENERKKEKNRSVRQRITAPIREWDVGKLPLESPERDEEKKRLREKEKDRSAEKKKEKKDSRHKQEEETSAKLLDDLFRKTKTTPCIYWLPLTEEQIQSRIEERKQRQVERERRRREEEDMRSQRKEKSRGSRSRSRSPTTRRR